MQKNINQAEMAESEGIQAIVNQAATQTATAVMMVLRDANAGSQPATIVCPRKQQRDMTDKP